MRIETDTDEAFARAAALESKRHSRRRRSRSSTRRQLWWPGGADTAHAAGTTPKATRLPEPAPEGEGPPALTLAEFIDGIRR